MTRQAEFTMPSLGADMDEGTIVEWLVKPGDEVHKGDIVAVVDTAKAAVEVECFDEGVIERLLVEPGHVVPVGTPLAVIGAVIGAGAGAGAGAPEPPRAAIPPLPLAVPEPEAGPSHPVATPTAPSPSPPAGPGPHVFSPIVRHLAAELGVDLATIIGTGKAGAVTRADVEHAAAAAAPVRAPKAPTAPTAPHAPQAPPRAGRLRVSPLARRLAGELGVDLYEVTGTGAQGAIRADDVRQAAQHRIAGPAAVSTLDRQLPARPEPARPVARREPAGTEPDRSASDRKQAMRQAIGRLMARSKREIPHYYLSTTVDLTAALAWMRERNRELPVPERLLPAALLLKATALAARKVPDLNGFWADDAFVPGEAVNLGVAVSLRGGGLVTPAVHDAASLGLTELMARLKDLAIRARSGRLRGSELTGGTITVTNLGDQGVESVTGVIFPPQVALVGIGKIVERPWAVDGLLGVRPVVTVTLAADHRATDGYTGGRFLDTVARLLQRPEELES